MWKQAKVTVGEETADQAMVDFTGKTPVVLEWPTPLKFNTEIKVGEEIYFAGYVPQAIGGKFHMVLMRDRLLSEKEREAELQRAALLHTLAETTNTDTDTER